MTFSKNELYNLLLFVIREIKENDKDGSLIPALSSLEDETVLFMYKNGISLMENVQIIGTILESMSDSPEIYMPVHISEEKESVTSSDINYKTGDINYKNEEDKDNTENSEDDTLYPEDDTLLVRDTSNTNDISNVNDNSDTVVNSKEPLSYDIDTTSDSSNLNEYFTLFTQPNKCSNNNDIQSDDTLSHEDVSLSNSNVQIIGTNENENEEDIALKKEIEEIKKIDIMPMKDRDVNMLLQKINEIGTGSKESEEEKSEDESEDEYDEPVEDTEGSLIEEHKSIHFFEGVKWETHEGESLEELMTGEKDNGSFDDMFIGADRSKWSEDGEWIEEKERNKKEAWWDAAVEDEDKGTDEEETGVEASGEKEEKNVGVNPFIGMTNGLDFLSRKNNENEDENENENESDVKRELLDEDEPVKSEPDENISMQGNREKDTVSEDEKKEAIKGEAHSEMDDLIRMFNEGTLFSEKSSDVNEDKNENETDSADKDTNEDHNENEAAIVNENLNVNEPIINETLTSKELSKDTKEEADKEEASDINYKNENDEENKLYQEDALENEVSRETDNKEDDENGEAPMGTMETDDTFLPLSEAGKKIYKTMEQKVKNTVYQRSVMKVTRPGKEPKNLTISVFPFEMEEENINPKILVVTEDEGELLINSSYDNENSNMVPVDIEDIHLLVRGTFSKGAFSAAIFPMKMAGTLDEVDKEISSPDLKEAGTGHVKFTYRAAAGILGTVEVFPIKKEDKSRTSVLVRLVDDFCDYGLPEERTFVINGETGNKAIAITDTGVFLRAEVIDASY